MKIVTSLPYDVIFQGESFVDRYKINMLGCVAPAFSFFLLPEELDFLVVFLLSVFYFYVIFLSGLSRILWKFDKPLWCQLFLSLLFGLAAVVFFRFFDIQHWLIHDVGYFPDGEVKHYYATVFFAPLLAAYLDSFKKVELAFYKSKGFDYRGMIVDINGL
ncbi:hypothetical protein [Pseudoalteromonas rubra]|uniref:hypothetical protein n=1 Tax=Pseudoalteromonas rubra TaxID=43658 RepID=UPI002DC020AE|nr:hypothetical protein [Pseudoalteromonas rubra]MEC4091703.1 hypothetical protein [Pseudoalteromonas rubra]